MYVQRKIKARSRNYSCREKSLNITYYECVSVALVSQYLKCIRHIVICDLSGSTTFFHIAS